MYSGDCPISVPPTEETLLNIVPSFEIRIGIVAACIPALRPGYKWLTHTIGTIRSSKAHYKLNDEVHLSDVSRRSPAQGPAPHIPPTFANDALVDVEQGHKESLQDGVRKSSTKAIDYK